LNGLQTGFYDGVNGNVNALTLDIRNNLLYLGGSFVSGANTTSATGVTMYSLGFWNVQSKVFNRMTDTRISTDTGVLGQVNALSLDTSRNLLYFGGSFTTTESARLISLNNIGYWNISNSTYNRLEDFAYGYPTYGVVGNVNTLSIDISRNLLYFGGQFTSTSAFRPPGYIGIWNNGTSTFSALTNYTPNNFVNTITLDSSINTIYFGGNFNFTASSNNSMRYIGYYNKISNSLNPLRTGQFN
jgi:hypothetical protein